MVPPERHDLLAMTHMNDVHIYIYRLVVNNDSDNNDNNSEHSSCNIMYVYTSAHIN